MGWRSISPVALRPAVYALHNLAQWLRLPTFHAPRLPTPQGSHSRGSTHSLRTEHLGHSIVQLDLKGSIVTGRDAIRRIEQVAQGYSRFVRGIRDGAGHLLPVLANVGHRHEDVTPGESIELVVRVTLDLRLLPHLRLLAMAHDRLEEQVQWSLLVVPRGP